jgi:DNA-binding MarR family transcriptional regulator
MLFQNLTRIAAFERVHMRYIRSREDWAIVVAIGEAAERRQSIGYKQLSLLDLASPSTLTRKLKHLIGSNAIRRVAQPADGRMVTYTLTKTTSDAFRRYERLLRSLRWKRDNDDKG